VKFGVPSTDWARMASPVQLLWTGGWDSSFRLLHALLVEGRPVRPIYLIDPGRDSTLLEVRAMEAIRRGVLDRLDDPQLLAPTEVHVRTHFPPVPELVRAHEELAGRAHVGDQYLWLAAAAEALGWQGVELAMERYEGGASPLQRLLFDESGRLRSSPDARLFRYWSFPVLHLTKAQMRDLAQEHGFLDLLLQRWFCFTPVAGRPCGLCRPCRLAHREGVRFVHPAAARTSQLLRVVRRDGSRGTAARILRSR
jgi:hypothetical protein